MSATLKIFVTVVLLGLCLTGYYIMDYQAKLSELEQLETQVQAAERRLADNRARLARLPEVTQRMQLLERELSGLLQSPGSDDPEQFVTAYLKDLEHLVLTQQLTSGDNSFSIQSVTPGAEAAAPAQGEALERAPRRVFEMSFQGRYQTLADFLVELGRLKLDRLVTINKIVLAPVSTKEPGVLQIQMPVTAYLRQGG